VTVTFIVYKQGLLTGQAADFVGHTVLAELSLGDDFQQQVFCQHIYQDQQPLVDGRFPLMKRRRTSHKGDIGLILTIGGNVGMPGAIRLASEAALRGGAALVAVCCHQENQALVFQGRPELMLAPSEAQALAQSSAMEKAKVFLLGPGLGQQTWSQGLFNLVIKQCKSKKDQPLMVLDADALTLLANTRHYCENWVLTPHPKEAATLLNCSTKAIEEDRFKAVSEIAKKYGGICVLKGAGTLISDGERVVINSTGNAGMASGGMGDVLSGIIAAFILQAEDYFSAVCFAVYIHGAAGDIIADEYGQRGMLASDLFTPIQRLSNQD
ncbi:MAG: NAD(P)H-hydrate dehydratase, partial [Colwellia sp.]|nr:NAD(P)H-hydrate dehydratase [Colwellia sp.]